MNFFEIIGKILDFIREILVGFVILTVICIIGIIFGFVVLLNGLFGLFETKKNKNLNDPDLDE